VALKKKRPCFYRMLSLKKEVRRIRTLAERKPRPADRLNPQSKPERRVTPKKPSRRTRPKGQPKR
jgi:hypothetical protein